MINKINLMPVNFEGKTRKFLSDGTKTDWKETSPFLDVVLINTFGGILADKSEDKTVVPEKDAGFNKVKLAFSNGNVQEFKFDGQDIFTYSTIMKEPNEKGIIGEEWEFSYKKEANPMIKDVFDSFLGLFNRFFKN
ncbi:MAG: hypothetical protein AB1782_06765 [Cyanobacteriota bacterium]